jgi:hypothetical protein
MSILLSIVPVHPAIDSRPDRQDCLSYTLQGNLLLRPVVESLGLGKEIVGRRAR